MAMAMTAIEQSAACSPFPLPRYIANANSQDESIAEQRAGKQGWRNWLGTVPQRFQRGWCKADAVLQRWRACLADSGAYTDRSRVLSAEMELKRRAVDQLLPRQQNMSNTTRLHAKIKENSYL